jgi:antitoxin FitA
VAGAGLKSVNAIIDCMASITIRKLDDQVKLKLRIRAAQHGRSMEEEAREILSEAMKGKTERETNLYDAMRVRLKAAGIRGIELPKPERGPWRKDPDFGR